MILIGFNFEFCEAGKSNPVTPPESNHRSRHAKGAAPPLTLDVLIGSGGMGMVFRGRQPGPRRVVAIKKLRPEFASNEAIVERFRLPAPRTGGTWSYHTRHRVLDLSSLPTRVILPRPGLPCGREINPSMGGLRSCTYPRPRGKVVPRSSKSSFGVRRILISFAQSCVSSIKFGGALSF